MFGPTAAKPLVTGETWFTMAYMSCVFVLITNREKKLKELNAENNRCTIKGSPGFGLPLRLLLGLEPFIGK